MPDLSKNTVRLGDSSAYLVGLLLQAASIAGRASHNKGFNFIINDFFKDA
jgi:hypothetical protein